jgi:hypothetical protein
MTKEDSTKKAYQWAKALKLLDFSVNLILREQDTINGWNSHVLKECITYNVQVLDNEGCLVEIHNIHLYTASNDNVQNAVGDLFDDLCRRSTNVVPEYKKRFLDDLVAAGSRASHPAYRCPHQSRISRE